MILLMSSVFAPNVDRIHNVFMGMLVVLFLVLLILLYPEKK